MKVINTPCQSCPYRKDCPSGVWAKSEYEKLRQYDPVQVALQPEQAARLRNLGFPDHFTVPGEAIGKFLCHQSTAAGEEILCRGWLSVHKDTVPVKLLMMNGEVTPEEVYQKPTVPLHESGNAAADAGEKQIKRPSRSARSMSQKLLARGIARMDEPDYSGGLFACATRLVSCPRCGALPGATCHQPSGRTTTKPHVERSINLNQEHPQAKLANRVGLERGLPLGIKTAAKRATTTA
jgi:hypothetical protein